MCVFSGQMRGYSKPGERGDRKPPYAREYRVTIAAAAFSLPILVAHTDKIQHYRITT